MVFKKQASKKQAGKKQEARSKKQASFLAEAQKVTLGTGTGASEAPLGPACHGVVLFLRPPKLAAAGFKGFF